MSGSGSNWRSSGAWIRLRITRLLARLGFRDDSFLLLVALLIGVTGAAAAVTFHELIDRIRNGLYYGAGPEFLYGRGVWLIVLLPALGGLVVGVFNRLVGTREGHGVIDVIESVARTSGFVRPRVAIEKILTSAVTIGSGGSAGAEGPIVQIGAAIASGFGRVFHVARRHMPILIGCGSAAGISSIFNAPIGGVLFTLEVILFDFSIRAFTPVVLASVIANVTTKEIFRLLGHPSYDAIFAVDVFRVFTQSEVGWGQLPHFALLGLCCGLAGVSLTRVMHVSEKFFGRWRLSKTWRPAAGGLILGLMGLVYVVGFGWLLWGQPKPFAFRHYPMPAFFGDGYGVIRQLMESTFYDSVSAGRLMLLLAFLCVAKIFGTCATLASGGSGGIIAPSVFLGAAAGGLLGLILRAAGIDAPPALYALVGMGAVLAAVVHAPLASILILFELTHDHKIMLPAMLASVLASGTARMLCRDSIYTLSLRQRGVHLGTAKDLTLLRRLTVEQVPLEPATTVRDTDPFQRVLQLSGELETADFVVTDDAGRYLGLITAEDIKTALLQREAIPLLLASELARPDVPIVRSGDDLASVLDTFALHDVGRLPVGVSGDRVVGLVSRAALMKKYQESLAAD